MIHGSPHTADRLPKNLMINFNEKFTLPAGKLIYPALLNEKEFNNVKSGKYEVLCFLDERLPGTQELVEAIDRLHKEAIRTDPKYAEGAKTNYYTPMKPATKKVDGVKAAVENTIAVKATAPVNYRTGDLAPKPKLLTADLQPFDPGELTEIPNNTEAECLVSLGKYSTAMATGINMRLHAVRILELGSKPLDSYFSKSATWGAMRPEPAVGAEAPAVAPAVAEPEVDYDF